MNKKGPMNLMARAMLCVCFSIASGAFASTPIEPGLEAALKWKWQVIPSPSSQWGLPHSNIPKASAKATTIGITPFEAQQNIHIVRQGEVLIHIARKNNLTTAQLKEFNALEDDLIRIDQVLRIPNAAERLALRSSPSSTSSRKSQPSGMLDSEVYLLRIFLDAEGFSSGPISNIPDPVFGKILHRYQTSEGTFVAHRDVVALASRRVGPPALTYELRPTDFRFIASPKAIPANGRPTAPVYSEMIQSSMLAYRSPWEFVAERFNADEEFLRKLNPSLPTYPAAGSVFVVPNVTPFEIENLPFLKQAEPERNPSITARIVDLSVFEILLDKKLVVAMPISRVRPGLRGSGEWRILNSIARPALSTLREPRARHVEQRSPFYTNPNPTPTIKKPTLSQEEILPPGPNNPLGVGWINLSKEGSSPLPYGIHGSSNPSAVEEIESLGGFRVSNRDIVRAIQLLPKGTLLKWTP